MVGDACRLGQRRRPEVSAASTRAREPCDEADHAAVDAAIVNYLDAIESGDADQWWRLNLELLEDGTGRDPIAELQPDLTGAVGGSGPTV